MRAVQIVEESGPDTALRLVELDEPEPSHMLTPGAGVLHFLGTARLAMSEVHIRSAAGVTEAPGRERSTRAATPPPTLGVELEELRLEAPQVDRYTNRLTELAADLAAGHNRGRKQVFFTATKGGREKVERLLKEFNVPFADDPPAPTAELAVTPGALARGFDFAELGLTVYSEWDLFEPPTSTRIGGRKRKTEAFVTDLRDEELAVG